jgi:hypothetical protein
MNLSNITAKDVIEFCKYLKEPESVSAVENELLMAKKLLEANCKIIHLEAALKEFKTERNNP